MDTIHFTDLSERNQREIDRDTDECYDWYARIHGRGHQVTRVEKSQAEFVAKNGGMGAGWMKVVYE